MLLDNFKDVKILLVDDEEDLLEIEKMNFETSGATVETANSGNQAIGMYEKGKYDLVVTDIRMPDGDGISLINSIRSKDRTTPIVCASAFSDYTEEQLFELGANLLISKPFFLDEVSDSIISLLRKP